MKLKDLLTYLLKEDTPDDEERGLDRAQQPSARHPTPTEQLQNAVDSEKAEADAGAIQNGGAIGQEEADPAERDEDDSDLEEFVVPDVEDSQPTTGRRGLRYFISRIRSNIFPSPNKEEEIQAYIPHYRILPIVSGVVIPFAILLEIPGLTARWYIRTEGSAIVATKPNPPLLDAGIAVSLCCAVIANICLVLRYLERRIKTMTILCAVFLSIHDTINVIALATFGGTKDGYTYGQAFWLTLCSTIVSTFVNVTLIVDLIQTPDFKRSGSGLTRRQRSLVIIIIGLFCYIALGALVNSLLLDLSFINGLYFTVVTIETIGFGDIVPHSKGSRVFICFYATLGIINLAFVVGYIRETVLEGLDFGYRKRLISVQERRRAATRRKRAEHRWRHAVIWRLKERRAPVWIPNSTTNHKSLWSKLGSGFWGAEWAIRSTAWSSRRKTRRRHGTKLNLWALPRCQLEAAALEAGVPLDMLLPADFYDTYDQDACIHPIGGHHHTFPSWFAVHPVYHRGEHAGDPPTHRRLGAMAVMLTKLSFVVYESGGSPLSNDLVTQQEVGGSQDSSGSLQTSSDDSRDYRADVKHSESKAYFTRSGLSWGWFLIFWMGGAAIFKLTEGWPYGSSVYFCFIAFTTIGYGDLTLTTPAGRSIFVVWALVGVATMTIFISVVSEAYTSRYKGILGRSNFNRVAQQYHKRTKVELSEKVLHIGASSNLTKEKVEPDVQDTTVERDKEEKTDVAEVESPSPDSGSSDGEESEGGSGDRDRDMDDVTAPIASTSTGVASRRVPDTHPQVRRTQRSLEELPRQILQETRSIQQYMQLIGDLDPHSADVEKFVHVTLWGLIDDVMGERKLAECTKADIMNDGESRQTLMMLGIERSLKELVSISDQAIVAIRERDKIIATLEREAGRSRETLGKRP